MRLSGDVCAKVFSEIKTNPVRTKYRVDILMAKRFKTDNQK
jgi:hypothetical protein